MAVVLEEPAWRLQEKSGSLKILQYDGESKGEMRFGGITDLRYESHK